MRLIPALVAVCLLPALAVAGDLKPRAEVNVRAGTERSILMTEFWAPLAQQSDRVLYGDLRLMGDDGDNREGNLGFGYRQISTRTNSVLGGNVWIDRRRTENGNNFHQLTLGLESLGDTIDLRANGYLQLNSSKTTITPNIGSSTPYLAGSGIFFDTNGFIVEEPQDGFDAEIGYRLPVLQKHVDATRVYAGGYHFWGDTTDNVTGFRIRTESQVNSIFSVGARFQHDGPRGSQGFLEATFRFPFKSKKLYQEHGLKSRLDESPERDIDIVTGAKVDTGLMKPVLNATSGTTQRILYVDNTNTNGGDGSKDNPFNTLNAAQAALQDNDILYIYRGDGTSTGMNQGITIDKTGVSLIGSGTALTYNGYTLLNAGLSPVITNSAARLDNVTGNGITVIADNAFISGVEVNGALGAGISVYASGADKQWNSITIQNTDIINNIFYGILVNPVENASIENVLVDNNFVTGISRPGIGVQTNTGASFGNILVSNNIVTGNITGNGNGIQVQAQSAGSVIRSAIITNNISQNNQSDGIVIAALDLGNILYGEISNNTVHANGQSGRHGIIAQVRGDSIFSSLVIRNNTITDSRYNGLWLNNNASGEFSSVLVDGNTISNSGRHGIYLQATGTASSNNVFTNNVITSNGTASTTSTKYYGAYIDNDSTGSVIADFGGGSLGSTGNNRIYSNTYQEFFIDTQPGTGSTGGTTLSARNNWWGVSTGLATNRRTLDGTSTIDASNFLTQ